jgi:hypothetical protein
VKVEFDPVKLWARMEDERERRETERLLEQMAEQMAERAERAAEEMAYTYQVTAKPNDYGTRYEGTPAVQFIKDVASGQLIPFIRNPRGDYVKLVPETEIKAAPVAGIVRIDWLREANVCANQSEKIIRIQLEADGVVLIGMEGDEYETRSVSWEALEKATSNPIPEEIAKLEKQLDLVAKMKTLTKVTSGLPEKTA